MHYCMSHASGYFFPYDEYKCVCNDNENDRQV